MGWWVVFRVSGAKTFTILTIADEKKEGMSDWLKNYLHICHVVNSESIKIKLKGGRTNQNNSNKSMFHTILASRFLKSTLCANKQFAHRVSRLINRAHFWTKPHCALMYAVITEWRYEPVAPGLMSLLFLFQNVIKHIMFQVFKPCHPLSFMKPHSSAINLS